jgi:signal peptidase I
MENPERMERAPLPKTQFPLHPERAIFWACIAALLMKFLLFDFMITEGLSMLPAIKPGAVLLVARTAYGFRLPWSGGSAPRDSAPRDPVPRYLLRWSKPKAGDVVVFFTPQGAVAVKRCGALIGEDTFFALGDNTRESYDSRFYGPVPVDHIIGKVLGIK